MCACILDMHVHVMHGAIIDETFLHDLLIVNLHPVRLKGEATVLAKALIHMCEQVVQLASRRCHLRVCPHQMN